jgi:hypothetical protein
MLSSCYRCALILVLFVGFASCARGQSTQEAITKLQQQLDALNNQLADKNDKPDEEEPTYTSKITQISPARVVPPPRQEEIIVTRLYDLSDLFAIVPAYPARFQSDLGGAAQLVFPQALGGDGSSVGASGGGGMGGGGGVFNVKPQPESIVEPQQKTLWQTGATAGGSLDGAKTSVLSLIRAIQTTVSPEEWESAGGSSTIAQLGMALLITTNEPTHQQITALLGQFRKRWGTLRTVSLQAYWLWLDDAELANLLAKPDEKPKAGAPPFAFGSVDREKWNTTLTAADEKAAANEEQAGDAGGYRAAVTCYNGQTVHTLAGRQQLVVTDLQPQWLGPDRIDKEQQTLGGVGYAPRTALVQEGMALQVTPLTNTSGKYVVLDLQSRLAKLVERSQPAVAKEAKVDDAQADEQPAAKEQAAPGPQSVIAALPLQGIDISRLSTTLRVPVAEPYLVGGMSQASHRVGKDRLYLFVELHVQELRDDVESPAQLSAPAEEQTPAKK